MEIKEWCICLIIVLIPIYIYLFFKKRKLQKQINNGENNICNKYTLIYENNKKIIDEKLIEYKQKLDNLKLKMENLKNKE